jgi:hypothetical protein
MERLDLTRLQVEAIAAHLRDHLEDDERAYLDTLEGETDLFEWVRRLLAKIEEDEGNVAALKEQIGDRNTRKARAELRIETTREALKALLDCARLDKLVLPEATLSIRETADRLAVNDAAAVPEEYTVPNPKPVMEKIKAAFSTDTPDLPNWLRVEPGGPSLTIRRK